MTSRCGGAGLRQTPPRVAASSRICMCVHGAVGLLSARACLSAVLCSATAHVIDSAPNATIQHAPRTPIHLYMPFCHSLVKQSRRQSMRRCKVRTKGSSHARAVW